MVNPAYEAWRWQQLVAALDKAGYAIVKKPTPQDLERGRPRRGAAGV
jgi:hypothetical protein